MHRVVAGLGHHLAISAAILLVLASGLVSGLRAGRWNPSADGASAAAARLRHVPESLDGWSVQAAELDRRQVEAAEISGYLMRHYRHPRTGAVVSVLLVCGRPGPISVHTPDVCYSGSGYEMTGPPQVVDVPSSGGTAGARFRRADMRGPGAADPKHLRIFWAWNAGDGWKTPDRPRLAYAMAPMLYKLYVIRETVPSDRGGGDELSSALLHQLLPVLDRALFPGAGGRR
jgi:hypothetical protein